MQSPNSRPRPSRIRAGSLDQQTLYESMGRLGSTSIPAWRRQRLMNIGCDPLNPNNETEPLLESSPDLSSSYGSLPPPKLKHSVRTLPSLPDIGSARTSRSIPPSPSTPWSSRLGHDSTFAARRVSTYDAPAAAAVKEAGVEFPDTALNGVRVWYSSFSSVDWLHDAIKESSRRWRLRRRRSLRGRLRRTLDRAVGWLTVTVIGCLTAVVAWLITRSEQWLFDLKEGHCARGWWHAKRFCTLWETWSEALGERAPASKLSLWALEYVAYAIVAVTLALTSALLTIHLTASPSFITYKDSGFLGHAVPSPQNGAKSPSARESEPPRDVLYFAAGSGIPEIKTILSGFVIHGYLGARTLFTKSVGLSLSVASGLSLGKEGPFVHIACCIGNIVSRYFPKYETNEGKRREILSASAAAGVAVAFGAPIGGVLFSLEEVSYYFPPKVMWQSFFCAMIAAMTLRFLDPFGTGKLVLFHVTYDRDWHAYELGFFLILGVFGGVYGAYFSKLNYSWSRYVRNRTWLKFHPVFEVILVTFVTTVLCFLNPYTRMGGTELVANLFAECEPDTDNAGLCPSDSEGAAGAVARALVVALIVKGALTIVTFGIKVPAGIFVPTLGVGACFGRIVGMGVQWLHMHHPDLPLFAACHGDMRCVTPGLYAMIGAAATLSGVTRTTVSLAVIMFELTDTLTYSVPIMLAILTAKTVADALEPKGIYDLVIELSRLPYLDAKRSYIWGTLRVSDVTHRDVETIDVDVENTVRALRDKLAAVAGADSGLPILRRDAGAGGMRMVGYIGVNELEHALTVVADDADAVCVFRTRTGDPMSSRSSLLDGPDDEDPLDFTVYMDRAPLTVQTHSPLELVQQLFAKLGAKYVVVTDPDGCYEGVIEKKTWLAFIHREMEGGS